MHLEQSSLLMMNGEIFTTPSNENCIKNTIDFGNSTVGSLMVRGFPLFADFGLEHGKANEANFQVEPTFNVSISKWNEYLQKKDNNAWVMRNETSCRNMGSPDFTSAFTLTIGYQALIDAQFDSLLRFVFENRYGDLTSCSHNSYCRAALTFAESAAEKKKLGNSGSKSFSRSYFVEACSGPLYLRSPIRTLAGYYDPENFKFSDAYLEALDALPEAYDREAYFKFAQRFGFLWPTTFSFGYTSVDVAGELFTQTGSKKHQGQECSNPEPNTITYERMPASWLAKLSLAQKARYEEFASPANLVDMTYAFTLTPTLPTESPTASPVLSTRAPTEIPTQKPTSCATKMLNRSMLLVLGALLLWCDFI